VALVEELKICIFKQLLEAHSPTSMCVSHSSLVIYNKVATDLGQSCRSPKHSITVRGQISTLEIVLAGDKRESLTRHPTGTYLLDLLTLVCVLADIQINHPPRHQPYTCARNMQKVCTSISCLQLLATNLP
jgi:hypothetical protein